LTVNETLIDGTTTGGNPDVTNITISGATYGTTAATQTGVTLTAGTAGVLETLNITSSGAAANTFALDANTNVTLGTVNLLGDADVTVRMEHADVTGTTVNGAVNTGSTTLLIDRQGAAAASTSLSSVAGVDVVAFRDSTAGTDALVASGVANASTVEVRSTFDVSTNSISVAGAAGSTTNVLNLNLDHSTASTRLQFGTLDVQDVETLNLASKGHDSALVAAGNAVSLTGDMTTVTVSGDTSIVVAMNIDTPSSGSRTTTVSAASMTGTATVTLNASSDANTTNLYTLTGTANGDTLQGGAGSGVLTGGAGNDSITGGAANDTIDGGDGVDTITATRGLDSVTGGAGNDIYDVNSQATASTAQVSTLLNLNTTVTLAANDVIRVTIDGTTYETTYVTSAVATLPAFVTAHAATILANHGVTVTSIDTNTDLNFVGRSTGASFSISADITDASGPSVATQVVTLTTAPVVGLTQRTTISDYALGDILDVIGVGTYVAALYYEGAAASAGNQNIMVLTDAAGFADAEAAEDAIVAGTASTADAAGIMVFLNSTLGFAQVVFDDDISADSADLGNSTGVNVLINLTGITTAAQLAAAFAEGSIVLA
jgi:S-layer protein